jgi:hypothetical protein
MVAGLNRELRKATAAAKAAARDSEQAWKSAGQGMKTALSQIGGVAGQVGGVLFELGEKVSAAGAGAGALGVAAGGAVVGVAALGLAARGLADGALSARDRLDEMGMAAAIPEESRAALAEYEQASKDLRVQVDLLTVSVGSSLAPALTDAASAAIGAVAAFGDVSDSLSGIIDPAYEAAQALSWLSPARWSVAALELAYGKLVARGEEVADQTQDAAVNAEDYYAALGLVNDGLTTGNTILGDYTPAVTKAAEATKGAGNMAAETAAAYREMVAARAAATNAAIAEIGAQREARETADAVVGSLEEMNVSLVDLQAEMADYSGSWEHLGDVAQQVSGEIGDALSGPIAGELDKVFGSIMELNDIANAQLQEQAEAQIARATEIAETKRDHQLEEVDRLEEIGRLSGKEAAAERKRINDLYRERQRAANKLGREEQRLARKNFKVNQALQITQAVMDGARAAVSLVPAFSFAGPLAPVLAAGVAAPATALQIAVIKKQEMPEFPTGGMVPGGGTSPDHRAIAAQGGEGVLSRRGVAAIGGPAAVDAANAGRGTGSQRVQVMLGRKVLAEAITDVLGRATLDPRRGKIDPQGGG